MKIRIYSLLFCGFALGPLSAFAQQSPLLEKYRTMARESAGTDFGRPFFGIIENCRREAAKLWWLSVYRATDLYGRTRAGIHSHGTASAIIGCQSGKGFE